MIPWRERPISQLFTWARWLGLDHVGLRLTKIYVPLGGAAVAAGLLHYVPGWNIAHEFGIIHQVNGVLQILAAFFIAALALIASFPGDALDRQMGGVPPQERNGEAIYSPSRREFFGVMFAYLSAACVILYVIGSIAMSAVNPEMNAAAVFLSNLAGGWILLALKAIYVAAVAHVIATTLLSLHFLGGFLSSSGTLRQMEPKTPVPPNVVHSLKRRG